MSTPDSIAKIFDVFLCHNSEDKPAIREISRQLLGKEIRPWLDEAEIRPGTPWQTALGQQIESIKSAAVFVGESGIGPWQNHEIQALLSQFVKRECPVIPVVLPAAKSTPKLPWTLENLHWVDFRVTDLDPLDQLVWGITGRKSGVQCTVSSSNHPPAPRNPDVRDLVPPKDKASLELRLSRNLDEFSQEEQEIFIAGLAKLLQLGPVNLIRAMPGSVRLHLELSPEDADKIYAAAQNGQLAPLGIFEARFYPAIAILPDTDQRSQLLILLNRVNETWVKGVLRNSVFDEALISLGKRLIEEAVDPPWKHVVELSSQRSELILQNRNTDTIFDATGLLLILGEPGSGKTTTLLELAANLIIRAKSDAKERIPFVLNLSTWKRKQPLARWIAIELSEKYRVPVKIARSWLQNDYLVPLLDGLDEVPIALQAECVAAVNDFIDESKPSGLVVCCRLMEYQWLPKRLKLNGAICLEPLSSEDVSKYLAKAGSKLAMLREAVDTDSVLRELAQTPLMLSIMSLAFQGVDDEKFVRQEWDTYEERRRQIFHLYVEQMFKRKGSISSAFEKKTIIGWLSWLARKMLEHSQPVFLVEGLQPSWLGRDTERASYGAVIALCLGLIFGMMAGLISGLAGMSVGLLGLTAALVGSVIFLGVGLGCWSESPIKNGIISGLIVGLSSGLASGPIYGMKDRLISGMLFGLSAGPIFGLICGLAVGSLKHASVVESMSWSWSMFWRRTVPGLILGVIIGLISGLVCGAIEALKEGLLVGLLFGLLSALSTGLLYGLIGGFVSGLVGGFEDRVKADKASPNQGIKLSRKNSLIAFLIICLTIGPTVGLISALLGGANAGLIGWLIGGLSLGVIVGLHRGGSAVIKHYALRLILWLNGHTPLHFIKFLDHCAKLIFLKKLGGGYIFIHRMLLEYFAETTSQSTKAEDGKTKKVTP